MNGELYLKDILHLVSQDLLIPVMLILALLIVYMLWCIGSLLVEVIRERRHFAENVPQFINAVHAARYDQVDGIIEQSGMLKHQKQALVTVARNMGLPQADLFALAKREVSKLDEKYRRVVSRTDFAAKVAPMFGLMGTLIPLGPGIVAMGQGNTDVLSSSLLIAFDTTVAGLVAAAVCLFVTRIRRAWYAKYLAAVEASITSILQKADEAREAGISLPCGYVPERSSKAASAGEAGGAAAGKAASAGATASAGKAAASPDASGVPSALVQER